MTEAILYFVKLLRKAGVRVSTAEVQDCLRAVQCTGLYREDFKQALQTSLVKEARDARVFERLFDLYFNGSSKNYATGKEVYSSLSLQERAFGREGKGLARSGAGGPGPELLSALSSGDSARLAEIAQGAVETLGTWEQEDVDQVREKLREAQVNLEWFMVRHELEKQLEEGEIDYAAYRERHRGLEYVQEEMERAIKHFLVSSYGKRVLEKLAEKENLGETDFINLDDREEQQLQQEIKKLGRKLAFKKSRRYKPASRGRVDMRKVTRQALSRGGIPLEMAYRKKKAERPELVLLCDISNSVEKYSTFMLRLVYAAQECFARVHSFVFVDHISYVTPLFRRLEPEQALVEMKYLAGLSETGYSHFGQVFFEFYTGYLSLLTERSTLLILGDARNNWRYSGEDYLQQVSGCCRKLYWLNPQPKESWNREDSIIGTYAPFCTGVYECRNLNQLARLVNNIF